MRRAYVNAKSSAVLSVGFNQVAAATVAVNEASSSPSCGLRVRWVARFGGRFWAGAGSTPRFSAKKIATFHQIRDGVRGLELLRACAPCLFWQERWAIAHLLWSQHMLSASLKFDACLTMTLIGSVCSIVGPSSWVRGAAILIGLAHSAQMIA